MEGRAQGTVGASLCETVTTQHGRKDERKEVLGVVGNATSAVHSEPQSPASHVSHLLKDNAIKHTGSGETVFRHEALVVKCSPEKRSEDRAGRIELADDTLLHSFPDLGDTNHDGRSEFTHITGAVADRCVGESSGVTVAKGATDEEHQVLEGHLENMRRRQVCEDDFLVANTFLNALIKTGNCDTMVRDEHMRILCWGDLPAATRASCLIEAPLGMPVEPEVYMMQ